jgi:hypothetical protein
VSSAIIDFYNGDAPDDRGRFLTEIQSWPDDRLESVHNYIQWLFPLPEPSPVNPSTPLLDSAAIREFTQRPELRERMRGSFLRMLQFYGLEWHEGAVTRGASYDERSRNWLWPGNHNHLRITRILRCLRLAGLAAEASAFFACLRAIYDEERVKPRPAISAETFRFWTSAAG